MIRKTIALVTNPAAFLDRPEALLRQTQAQESLLAQQPIWCSCRRAMLYEDYKHVQSEATSVYLLQRDSAQLQNTKLHLPYVQELMGIASFPINLPKVNATEPDVHWRGILNNDTLIRPRFFPLFEEMPEDINCVLIHVWDVREQPTGDEIPEEAVARPNYNSLEGLFVRNEAIEIFNKTYPDVIFGWAWDEATVLWATNNDAIRIHAIDNPGAALHILHESPARAGALGVSNDVAAYNYAQINKLLKGD